MGKAEEYPSPQQIVDCFAFEFAFDPVPDVRGFSGLPDGFRERFADIYEQRAKNCAVTAQHDGVERLIGAVASFADVLRKDKPRIFEATLDQLKILHGVASSFNITGDQHTQAALDRLQADFLCYTKDQLTGNADNQRKAMEAADAVLKSLGMASPDPAHSGAGPEQGEGLTQQGTSEDDNSLDDPELAAALLGE
jgi:hypothetical protein